MTEYIYKTTNAGGMNTRPDHNVNNPPNGTVAYGTPTKGVELWTSTASGTNVMADDKWMRLDSPVIKWVAVVHMGKIYGTIEEVVVVPPPPPSAPVFPESFTLTDPQGNKAEYKFVRIVE